MDLLDKLRSIAARTARFESSSAHPGQTIIDDVLGPCEVLIGGRRTLMFGSNNYFGLTFHPDVTAAAKAALSHYGSGTTGSRVANGTLALHVELEREFAEWFGKREAMIFTTGYQTNLALIGALCGPGDVILIDSDSHASIYDGTRLSGAQVTAFRHNSPASLDKKLSRLARGHRNRLVVVEGLYSMGGDLAPLKDIVATCREHGAYVLVDEAHSLGIYGERGLGCCEDQGVLRDVDFIVGTFSKSLGGVGGFCVSDHPELRSVRFLARPYIFTASNSADNVASVRAARRVLVGDRQLREQLWANTRRMRRGLQALGYTIGSTESPIIPIAIGEEATTVRIWQGLLEAGVYVNVVLPPGCAQDRCLLRASCSAAHTTAQIDAALAAFGEIESKTGQPGHAAATRLAEA